MVGRSRLIACATAMWLAGCAGGAAEEARVLQRRSFIESVEPRRTAAVRAVDIAATRPDSPARALVTLWRDLQHAEWERAAARFEDGLRAFIGTQRLTSALIFEAAYFRVAKPVVTDTWRDGTRHTVVYGAAVPGRPTRWWTVWTRRDGRWRLRYWPFLDGALASVTQREVQDRLDPFAVDPSEAALKAGERARFLQYQYLDQARRKAEAARRRSPRRGSTN